MPILNIESLKTLAAENNLFGKDSIEENFQPSSYDLRIGAIYRDHFTPCGSCLDWIFQFGGADTIVAF